MEKKKQEYEKEIQRLSLSMLDDDFLLSEDEQAVLEKLHSTEKEEDGKKIEKEEGKKSLKRKKSSEIGQEE